MAMVCRDQEQCAAHYCLYECPEVVEVSDSEAGLGRLCQTLRRPGPSGGTKRRRYAGGLTVVGYCNAPPRQTLIRGSMMPIDVDKMRSP